MNRRTAIVPAVVLAATLALAAAFGTALPARAAQRTVRLKDFFGAFVGVATALDPVHGAVQQRDMDVTIGPEGNNGFQVRWTSVSLIGGRRDVPGVERWVEQASFVPSGDQGLYVEETPHSVFETMSPLDPLGGKPVRWARLHYNVLSVYSMTVDQGHWELQSYDRILTATGLDIRFQRFVDGVLLREIDGHTVRAITH